jgi:RNA polymerase sigma-70 factor (ECF subfamily)
LREAGRCGVIPEQRGALPVNMSDIELDDLFASCMPRLKRTARLMLRNPQDSEDALQEGLLLAFKKLGQFQGRSNFVTWLHSIVRNAALTHVRRMKCRPQYASEEEFANGGESTWEDLSVDPSLSPEDECARRERTRFLLDVLQEMPARYQSVVRLCDLDGMDQKEAAQKLGITTCALKTYLFRARRLAARRILGKVFHQDQSFQNKEHAYLPPSDKSGYSGTAVPFRDFKRTEQDRYPIPVRAREDRVFAGGKHEHC